MRLKLSKLLSAEKGVPEDGARCSHDFDAVSRSHAWSNQWGLKRWIVELFKGYTMTQDSSLSAQKCPSYPAGKWTFRSGFSRNSQPLVLHLNLFCVKCCHLRSSPFSQRFICFKKMWLTHKTEVVKPSDSQRFVSLPPAHCSESLV